MKRIEFKPIYTTILLIIFQSVCFFLSKVIQPTPILIGGPIDNKIPFNIWFIIPYCAWYFLIFIVPYYLYNKNKDSFMRYIYAYIFCTIFANMIFVSFPTTVSRPEVLPTNILNGMAYIVFSIDTPIMNCFPSLHCCMSMLFILYTFENKNISLTQKIIITIISILIMISTLFVKQHVFADLVSGNILAILVYFLVKILYKEENVLKKALKI